MTQQLKLNSGRLFPDTDPKTDKHPVATGPANIEGKEYRIALWKTKDKNDKPYYNLKFTIMQENAGSSEEKVVNTEDAIPF
jgi:hypothetical protein